MAKRGEKSKDETAQPQPVIRDIGKHQKRQIKIIAPSKIPVIFSSDEEDDKTIDASASSNPAAVAKLFELRLRLPALAKLPSYTEIKTKVAAVPHRRLAIAGAGLVGAAFLVVIVFGGKPSSDNSAQGVMGLQKGTPDYATLLPTGASIEDLGGWTRISPPDKDAVYAYVDKVGSVPISVSQQPLPANLKNNPIEEVEELAKSYNAGQKITAGDTVIHIGNSSKGAQSIIFTKNDLLILIKSDLPVSNDQWIQYVSSLR